MQRLLAAGCLLLAAAAPPPIDAVPLGRIGVQGGEMPLFLSQDWQSPLPGVTRAVLVVHGLNRDADTYFAALTEAASRAGAGPETLLIAPQILADEDFAAHHPGPGLLHWHYDEWAAGLPARGPEPASPFDGLDAILARLADRRLFPAMAEIVVAGHSAGGQMVQRYAVAGHGDLGLARSGVRVRYVVANPSSYVYFTPDRPLPGGGFAAPSASACPGYDAWRYGLSGNLPPYVTDPPAVLRERYAARDLTYLLGTRDTNPRHRRLDKSCAAELQGPHRLARGHDYMAHLRSLGATTALQRQWDVPGVAHDGPGMINSPCGLAALFGAGVCASE